MKSNKVRHKKLSVVEVSVELFFENHPSIQDVFDEIIRIEKSKKTKGITGFSWCVGEIPKVSYYKLAGIKDEVRDTGNKSSTKDD